jgi:DNA primase
MGGRIQDDAIRTIRERASLVEVASDVVALRRRGRSFLGLCPFHAEKTPSFTVSEERGFFHCFGCGEHGDVFSFVMKTEALAFPDAVRRVAERFGLPVPEESGGSRPRGEPLVAANAVAAAFFQSELAGPAGARARAYLAARGLADDTVRAFGIGYAPAGGEALVRHLRARGVPVEDGLTAGLILRRDRAGGGLFDRFRDRVMFPIVDPAGRVVAFGGRILPDAPVSGDPPPKYMNSPESPIFHKGHMVYGLAQARDAIRKGERAIVVEGYMDVVALAEAGVAEAVAPLGTALTVDQLRVLRRFTDRVIACFDGDAAGRRAAARSFPVFVEAGLWGQGAFLPAGDDPDSYVRGQGRDAFEKVIAAAVPLVDAYVSELAGPRADAVGRRADAAREVARVLKKVRNPFEHDVLAHLAAERLGVREDLLSREGAAEPEPTPAAPPRAGERGLQTPTDATESSLVALMALDPKAAERVRTAGVIESFQHPEWRRLAEMLAAGSGDVDRTTLVQSLPRELRDRFVMRLLNDDASERDDRERALADCIAAILRRPAGDAQRRLREAIRAAEARGDESAAAIARRQWQELTDKARS